MQIQIKEILDGRLLNEWLNDEYLEIKTIENLRNTFLINKPFRHLVLKNFIKIEKASKLLEELKQEKFILRESPNSFRLRQADRFGPEKEEINQYCEFLGSKEFISYINFLANLNVTKQDRFFSYKYENNDYFSPHTDKEGERKITLILYLTDLEEGDGGCLNFYSTVNNDPSKIEKKIISKFNTLVFFEISNKSYHEGERVIGNKPRFNIVSGFT